MPFRKLNVPFDPRGLPFYYKLSTFTDEVTNVDWMVIHKPKEDGKEGNELLFARPPFKPYYFIDESGYRQNTNMVDTILHNYNGTISPYSGVGTDGRKVFKVSFENDVNRKRSSFQLEKLVRTYQSNRPLTSMILQDLDMKVKGFPTRMAWDIEVDPRQVPNLQRTDGRIITICAVGYKPGSGQTKSVPARTVITNSRLMELSPQISTDASGVTHYVFRMSQNTDESTRDEVIKPFLKEAFNYSCITGFYSTKFDVPYSQIWIMRLGIAWDWDFITTMDMHNIYTVLNTNNYDDRKFNLESIAQREFGEGKEEKKDYQVLWDWWEQGDPRLESYCLNDADLVRRIDEKWNAIESRLLATNLTNVRPDAYVTYMAGIESIVLKRLNAKTPPKVMYTPPRKKGEEKSYEGAMVFEPVKGVHSNVIFLDAKSMYNRIIRTFNIGFDTLDPNGEIMTPKARFTNKFDSVLREVLRDLEYWRNYYLDERNKYEVDSERWHEFEKKQWVIKYYLVSVYGVLGCTWSQLYDSDVAEAITLLGQVVLLCARHIIEYMGYQVDYGDTDSLAFNLSDEEIFRYMPNDEECKPFKIKLCPKDSCRTELEWTWVGDPQTGGIQAWCPNCKKVSLSVKLMKMLTLGRHLADIVEFGVNYFAETRFHVNNPEMEFEVDKVYDWLYVTSVKKRNAGKMLWKGVPLPEPKLKVTGFEAKRTDWPPFVQKIQTDAFLKLGERAPQNEIIEDVEKKLDELYAGQHDPEIVQRKVIRKRVTDYGVKRDKVTGEILSDDGAVPPFVRAARMMVAERNVEIRVAQQILFFMACDSTGKVNRVIPVYEDEPLPKLDKEFYDYLKKQIYAILTRMELPVITIGTNNLDAVFA